MFLKEIWTHNCPSLHHLLIIIYPLVAFITIYIKIIKSCIDRFTVNDPDAIVSFLFDFLMLRRFTIASLIYGYTSLLDKKINEL